MSQLAQLEARQLQQQQEGGASSASPSSALLPRQHRAPPHHRGSFLRRLATQMAPSKDTLMILLTVTGDAAGRYAGGGLLSLFFIFSGVLAWALSYAVATLVAAGSRQVLRLRHGTAAPATATGASGSGHQHPATATNAAGAKGGAPASNGSQSADLMVAPPAPAPAANATKPAAAAPSSSSSLAAGASTDGSAASPPQPPPSTRESKYARFLSATAACSGVLMCVSIASEVMRCVAPPTPTGVRMAVLGESLQFASEVAYQVAIPLFRMLALALSYAETRDAEERLLRELAIVREKVAIEERGTVQRR